MNNELKECKLVLDIENKTPASELVFFLGNLSGEIYTREEAPTLKLE